MKQKLRGRIKGALQWSRRNKRPEYLITSAQSKSNFAKDLKENYRSFRGLDDNVPPKQYKKFLKGMN
jgi:hypothetical protein